MSEKISELGNRLAFTALEVLHDNDGKMSRGDLLKEIYKLKEKEIPKDAKNTSNSGAVRWEVAINFQSDNFVKAGFLRKEKGAWHLTAEGAKALPKGDKAVIEEARVAYQKWKALRAKNAGKRGVEDAAESREVSIEQYESAAISGIQEHIRALGPYAFQDLCAALLRGMNYHVRDVAAPGADGGIDVLAYTDPLGGRPPRLKVQVKHDSKKAGAPVLRQLAGLLTDGDIGVFVSSYGFAAGCRDFARNNGKHMELIDLPRFIELWQKHYFNLSEEDKALLPLQSVYFLDEKRAAGE